MIPNVTAACVSVLLVQRTASAGAATIKRTAAHMNQVYVSIMTSVGESYF